MRTFYYVGLVGVKSRRHEFVGIRVSVPAKALRADGRGRPSLQLYFGYNCGAWEVLMFLAKGPYCQSCGMPLSKDEKGGGTEADGRVSSEYCSHCYLGGAFTDPTLTAEQMVERVRGKLREKHIPGFLAKSIVKDIPTLGRWAKR